MSVPDSPSRTFRKMLSTRLASSSRLSIDGSQSPVMTEFSTSSSVESGFSLNSCSDERTSPTAISSSSTQQQAPHSPSTTLSPSRSFRKLLPQRAGGGSFSFTSPLKEKKISDQDLLCAEHSSFAEALAMCEAASKLDPILASRQLRGELVDELLAEHCSETVRKVRLLCAVNEVLRTTDRKERSAKAQMIVTFFVKDDSKYHVDLGVPLSVQTDVVHMKHEAFVQLRNLIAVDLAQTSAIIAKRLL